MEITLLEMYFGIDIVYFFMRNNELPIKNGSTQKELHEFLMREKRNKNCAAGDFSKYDTTIPKHLLYWSFHVIKSMLKLSDYDSRLFDILAAYIVEAGIYHPDTGYVFRERGIISGSFFTNLIDSLTNWYIMEYITTQCCSQPNFVSYSVSGDDSVFFYNQLNLSRLSNRAHYYFGMKLNFPDKHIFDKSSMHAHFLGSVFTPRGPIRDIRKMVIGCMITTDK